MHQRLPGALNKILSKINGLLPSANIFDIKIELKADFRNSTLGQWRQEQR